jgi:Flp pilus assembly protein TadG
MIGRALMLVSFPLEKATMIDAWRRVKARAGRLGKSGAAAVEFAFVAPVLLLIMTGIAQFGIALNQYVMLVNAINAGELQFSISRGSSTPYSSTVSVIQQSASTLTWASLSPNVTMSVGGTTCNSDSTCSALMTTGGLQVQVTGAYPVNLTVAWVPVVTFHTSCSTTTNICTSITGTLQ